MPKIKRITKTPEQGILFRDMVGQEFTATLEFIGKEPIIKNIKPIKEELPSDPEAGQSRFFVHCERLTIYTVIGADNKHHAANKATKLFGPNWSHVTQSHGFGRDHDFVAVKLFKKLLNSLPK